jgi:hypothetical protein
LKLHLKFQKPSAQSLSIISQRREIALPRFCDLALLKYGLLRIDLPLDLIQFRTGIGASRLSAGGQRILQDVL